MHPGADGRVTHKLIVLRRADQPLPSPPPIDVWPRRPVRHPNPNSFSGFGPEVQQAKSFCTGRGFVHTYMGTADEMAKLRERLYRYTASVVRLP